MPSRTGFGRGRQVATRFGRGPASDSKEEIHGGGATGGLCCCWRTGPADLPLEAPKPPSPVLLGGGHRAPGGHRVPQPCLGPRGARVVGPLDKSSRAPQPTGCTWQGRPTLGNTSFTDRGLAELCKIHEERKTHHEAHQKARENTAETYEAREGSGDFESEFHEEFPEDPLV